MSNQALVPHRNKAVKLSDYDPAYDGGMSKSEGKEALEGLRDQMSELQAMMYAQGKYSLLIVLQALDAGGKDGTIRSVFTGVNPQGFRITSFKAPSAEELSHDFLWRIHQATPPKGYIGIFNRSHYEDVLVVRVNNLVPEDIWKKRYDQINQFEKMLYDNNTVILKFYLHISKEEQRERFQERLDIPEKNWKFSRGDLAVREQWDAYQSAYADAIGKCNTEYAPWHIVPANRNWYRNYIIAKTIVDTMEAMPLAYPAPEADLDQIVIPD